MRGYAAQLRAIRRRGMAPVLTLNHFTLPTWLHDPIAVRDAFAGTGPDDQPAPGAPEPAAVPPHRPLRRAAVEHATGLRRPPVGNEVPRSLREEESVYIGVGTIVAIILIVLLIAFVF